MHVREPRGVCVHVKTGGKKTLTREQFGKSCVFSTEAEKSKDGKVDAAAAAPHLPFFLYNARRKIRPISGFAWC